MYVTGSELNLTTGKSVAKYWKNGNAVFLADSLSDVGVTCIAVSGIDVYMGGYKTEGGQFEAKLWKDDSPIPFADSAKNYISAITISGNDVFAAGQEWNGTYWIGKYWKNGSPTILSDGFSSVNVTAHYDFRE